MGPRKTVIQEELQGAPGTVEVPLMAAREETGRRFGLSALHPCAAFLVFFAISLATFPVTTGVRDEIGFINQAVIWSHGALSTEGAGLREVHDFVTVADRQVSWRNPGRSLLVLPLLFFGGLEPHFAVSILIHVALGILSVVYLRREKAPPVLSALVLFHPTLLLYSRTIMADAPCAALVLAAILLLQKQPGRGRSRAVLAGLFLGLAVVFRYQAGVLLLMIPPAVLLSGSRLSGTQSPSWTRRRQARDLLWTMVPGLAVVAVLMLYNWHQFGHILGYQGQGFFALKNAAANARAYLPALLVFWPLLLLSPLVDRSSMAPVTRYAAVPFLLLLLFYNYHDYGDGAGATWVLCLRLLQPVLPIWILSYAVTVHRGLKSLSSREGAPGRLRSPLVRAAAPALLVAVLGFGQAAMFSRHQAHLEQLQSIRAAILKNVPPGSTVLSDKRARSLFASLLDAQPAYRWIDFDAPENRRAAANPGPWYLALHPKSTNDGLRGLATEFATRNDMVEVESEVPGLLLFRSR